MSSLAVLSYAAVRGILILRQQRGFRDFENSRFLYKCLKLNVLTGSQLGYRSMTASAASCSWAVLPSQRSHGSQVHGSGKASWRDQRRVENLERVRARDRRWASRPMDRRGASNRSSAKGNRRRWTPQVNQISYHRIGRRRRLREMSKEVLIKGCHAQNTKVQK